MNGWNLDRRSLLTERLSADPRRATAVFEVAVRWTGGATTEATSGAGQLAFDEATWSGGGGAATHPIEGLLGALGASIANGLTARAALAGRSLASLTIHVEGGVDLARTYGVSAARPVVDRVQVEVALAGPIDPTLAGEWLAEAIARCPIAGLFAAAGEPIQVRLIDVAGD